MRFDDMLATVLARPAERPGERAALWRQLIDLLAQRRPGADSALEREAFVRLHAMRAEVPVPVRRETAHALAGRGVAPALVAFLAEDAPLVAAAILSDVVLDEAGWLAILPRLSPTGRGILRHRRDLGSRVEAALAGFGATDLALSGTQAPELPVVPPPPHTATLVVDNDAQATPPAPAATTGDAPVVQTLEHGAGEGQIRAIINRIAHFQQNRDPAAPVDKDERATGFRFETGSDGLIRWVDGVPRGPLIGETIAIAASGAYGVDGLAPRAFALREPFRAARYVVAGHSAVAGEWRLSGVPVFAPGDGRFQGYRGSARRPRADEALAVEPEGEAGLYGGDIAPDSLRQLVHELRTPLNAIGGFAEMIRRQMRGPISAAYRDRAGRIVEQAGRLLAAVDDLDVAARLETQRLDLQRLSIDLGGVIETLCDHHAEAALRRGVRIERRISAGLPPVIGDPAAMRRMAGRLIASVAAIAGAGETIAITLDLGEQGALRLEIDRPARLDGQNEQTLLDPGYGPEGDAPDAPLLGLGFSLHLVRRLAIAAGGGLEVEARAFRLRLPIAHDRLGAETVA